MAIKDYQQLNSLNFSGSNALRAQAANQIKQGLSQGQQAFQQFNTGLTNQATQQGLNQIRNLGSRAEVEANPLSGMTPTYADQSVLQSAYDANKVKQQGLYEDNMMQQAQAKLQGIQTLEDYGNTTAEGFLSDFGQHMSAAKKARLGTDYANQENIIKQQMSKDYTWNQQQQTISEEPKVNEFKKLIQGANVGDVDQVKAQINQSGLSDETKTSLLGQADQRTITARNMSNSAYTFNEQQKNKAEKPDVDKFTALIQNTDVKGLDRVRNQIDSSKLTATAKANLFKAADQRSVTAQSLKNNERVENQYQAQQTINKFTASTELDNQRSIKEYKQGSAKANLVLHADGSLNTEGMSDKEAILAERAWFPLLKAFKQSTQSTEEVNEYLTSLQGVEGYTPDMLNKAKADYKAHQKSLDNLTPELQEVYNQDMGIYKDLVNSKIETINMEKANAVKQYEDVSSATNADMSMDIADATVAARTAILAQGFEIDQNDMADALSTLMSNSDISKSEPYVLVEVAKALQLEIPFLDSLDDKDFDDAEVSKLVKRLIVEARSKSARAQSYLDAKDKWDTEIADLNNSKLEKGKALTARLHLLNPKIKSSLYKD